MVQFDLHQYVKYVESQQHRDLLEEVDYSDDLPILLDMDV